jgi:hypothetical protein
MSNPLKEHVTSSQSDASVQTENLLVVVTNAFNTRSNKKLPTSNPTQIHAGNIVKSDIVMKELCNKFRVLKPNMWTI